jgi:hypothetical protein
MFIRCHDGRVLNSRYCKIFNTGSAAKTRRSGNTTYMDLPEDGVLVFGWTTGPVCIGRYNTQLQADHALRLLFDALAAGRNTFDYPRCE